MNNMILEDNFHLNLCIMPTIVIYHPSASNTSNFIVDNNYLSSAPPKTSVEVVIVIR